MSATVEQQIEIAWERGSSIGEARTSVRLVCGELVSFEQVHAVYIRLSETGGRVAQQEASPPEPLPEPQPQVVVAPAPTGRQWCEQCDQFRDVDQVRTCASNFCGLRPRVAA